MNIFVKLNYISKRTNLSFVVLQLWTQSNYTHCWTKVLFVVVSTFGKLYFR